MVSTLVNKTYANGVLTVESLRKQGYKVRVYHGRQYRLGLFGPASRREYEQKYNIGYSNDVMCHGGFTRVEVTGLDGRTATGKYNFGNRQFNRKIGLQAAIGRALASLSENQ